MLQARPVVQGVDSEVPAVIDNIIPGLNVLGQVQESGLWPRLRAWTRCCRAAQHCQMCV